MSTQLSSVPDPSRRHRPRPQNLTIALSVDQYAALRVAADDAGTSISSLIRRAHVVTGVLPAAEEVAGG